MLSGQRQPPVNLDFAGLSAGFDISDVQRDHGASRGVVRRYLYLASFLQGVSCGILEPFFQDQSTPPEKLRDVFGFSGMHGFYVIGVFLMSPLTAQLMMKGYKLRKVFQCGLFFDGLCCAAYEFLIPFSDCGWLPVLRVVQATGASLSLPGYFFIVCVQFPNDISWLLPKVGCAYSLGMIAWSFSGGFLFGTQLLMFPFLCIGCCLMLCSFWAPLALTAYRQNRDHLHGFLNFIGDNSLLTDLALMSSTMFVFTTNRLNMPHVLYKYCHLHVKTHELAALSSPLNILAAAYWNQRLVEKRGSRGASIVGMGLLLIGTGLSTMLADYKYSPLKITLLLLTGQIVSSCGIGMTFISSFLHALRYSTTGEIEHFPHILLSGFVCTAVSLGHILGMVFDGYVMDERGFKEGSTVLLQIEAVIFALATTSTLYGYVRPSQQRGQLGYTGRNGALRL